MKNIKMHVVNFLPLSAEMLAAWIEILGGKFPIKYDVSTSNPWMYPGIPNSMFLLSVCNKNSCWVLM